jgi:hypothetical protein
MKWYWWIFGALVLLYFIGKQKHQSLQQEIAGLFNFCGTLTSGDTFDGTITTIAPGINEGNLSQARQSIGTPTTIDYNFPVPTPIENYVSSFHAPMLYPVLPPGVYAV